jgi:hypothetical protein
LVDGAVELEQHTSKFFQFGDVALFEAKWLGGDAPVQAREKPISRNTGSNKLGGGSRVDAHEPRT